MLMAYNVDFNVVKRYTKFLLTNIDACIGNMSMLDALILLNLKKGIQSNKARGIVGKLRFQQTGSWEITACLPGGSYELRHCCKHNTKDKKKVSNNPGI